MNRLKNRLLGFLLCALLLSVLCTAAFAAPGDTVLYPQRSFYNEWEEEEAEPVEEGEPNEYATSVAIMPDGVYTLVSNEKVTRWQPGDEAPVTLFELPSDTGYWSAYYNEDMGEEPPDPAEMAKIEASIHQLIPGDDGLYALNLATFRLAKVDGDSYEFLDVDLELPPMMMTESEWVNPRQVYNAFVFEGSLFLLLGSEQENDWNSRFLYRVGLDGSPFQAYTDVEGLQVAAPYKDGQLLVLAYSDMERRYGMDLRPLEIESGTPMLPLNVDAFQNWYNAGAIAYAPAEDALYYVDQSQVQRMDMKTGKTMGLTFLSGAGMGGNDSSAGMLDDGFFALSLYEGIFIRNIDPAYKVERALRIGGGWENTAYRKFIKDNPEIPVLLLEEDYFRADSIAQAIQTGETEIDIFNIYIFSDLPKLIEKGYAADLSGSEILTADVAEMYPQVQAEITGPDGKLYAYPVSLYYNPMRVNLTLFEKYFPGEELPETWEEFLTLYLQFLSEEGDSEDVAFLDFYVQKDSLIYTILRQYARVYEQAGGEADFENPALRTALELVAQLPEDEGLNAYDTGMSADDIAKLNDYYARQNIFTTETMLFEDPVLQAGMVRTIEVMADGGRFYRETYSDEARDQPVAEARLMPEPVFEPGQEPSVSGQLSCMIINPNSSNLELAMQYLEAMVGSLETEANYALHPALNEPVRDSYYARNRKYTEDSIQELTEALPDMPEEDKQAAEESLSEMQARLAENEANEWRLSPGGIAAYREMAPYITLKRDGVFDAGSEEIYDLMSRYVEGQMQLDAFLKELNGKARMIRMEQM